MLLLIIFWRLTLLRDTEGVGVDWRLGLMPLNPYFSIAGRNFPYLTGGGFSM